jgi:hypothetical protein
VIASDRRRSPNTIDDAHPVAMHMGNDRTRSFVASVSLDDVAVDCSYVSIKYNRDQLSE